MYQENGIGLAANQAGYNRQMFVMDVSNERNDPQVFINPVITTKNNIKMGDIEGCLSCPGVQVSLVDARTREEYIGAKQLSARSGHIPGAVNLNWLDTIDTNNHLRLKPRRMLKDILEARQILPAREVITYCQTHHRSAHTWMLLKSLGYPAVRGYPGSWSEWGNDPETPIQTLSEVNP